MNTKFYCVPKDSDLMHYGIKGMKWGVRKDPDRQSVRTARAEYREANRDYNETYKRAYDYSTRHPISQYIRKSRHYNKSNELWGDVWEKSRISRDKKTAYKKAKKDYRNNKRAEKINAKEIKSQYRAQYNKGKSRAARIVIGITGSDKIYADTMYNLDKKHYD